MDRFVPRRRRFAILLALALGLGTAPEPGALARLPILSEEPAGDPGDGVLRPADQSPAEAAVAQSATGLYLLVPVPVSAGSSWPIAFRLVRIDRSVPAIGGRHPSGGRWHRAP